MSETSAQKAIRKAREVRSKVLYLGNRTYRVVTPAGHSYRVRPVEEADGTYLRCQCKAAATWKPCYHVFQAAAVDQGIQRMREAAGRGGR